ncbi:MAG: DUF952 domain-containing protein [Hyphomicrobiales bacterium]
MTEIIYKICPRQDWQVAKDAGVYTGAPVDLADGFIHFSSATQVAGTAAKHFAGQEDLVLLEIDVSRLDGDLHWEVSRDDALFPHLYDTMPVSAVVGVHNLAWDGEKHIFPEGIPG